MIISLYNYVRPWALVVPQEVENVERNKCSTTAHMKHLSLTVILCDVANFVFQKFLIKP